MGLLPFPFAPGSLVSILRFHLRVLAPMQSVAGRVRSVAVRVGVEALANPGDMCHYQLLDFAGALLLDSSCLSFGYLFFQIILPFSSFSVYRVRRWEDIRA